MKLGAYAHISISVRSLRESSPFYKTLGFEKLWHSSQPRPWELLTDGIVNIHLYEAHFTTPALHYFSASMDQKVIHLKRIGIDAELQRSKVAERLQHNFYDPNEFCIMLMHYDDGSMPKPDGIQRSLLGTFGGVSIATDNIKASILFWDKVGFRQCAKSNMPYAWAELTDDVVKIVLHQTGTFSAPALTYYASDVVERIAALQRNKISITHELKTDNTGTVGAILTAPDGQLFFLLAGVS